MTHLIYDELRRQFETGEIDRATYVALRGTRAEPPERLCEVPRCTRQAYRMERGKGLCAVCFQKAENLRRRKAAGL